MIAISILRRIELSGRDDGSRCDGWYDRTIALSIRQRGNLTGATLIAPVAIIPNAAAVISTSGLVRD